MEEAKRAVLDTPTSFPSLPEAQQGRKTAERTTSILAFFPLIEVST